MLLKNFGESLEIGGKVFTVGDRILANDVSDYEGLYGKITEIKTDPDKDTDNEGIDIHVRFEIPENKEMIKKIEEKFSKLYGEPKTIDEIPLDLVIMAADELEIINK